ncbi:hypothetical protein [Shewanella scandinavica]|uniref:DUF1643 domain-containing protein n=1 Tax=Shewanella scandinavica TaxID=3063538 RepID=A0ABU3FZ83_9GAMM|nr:hypothetical protein [Shewanella sp. SP2S1-2]MDT3280688.1 hypothetical protein [Shewanella sp. SP2S1-2]
MEFIYADELKTKFSVYGHFYDLKIKDEIFNCRSVLEIVSKTVDDISNSKPCAVVVMMNPGSSRPLRSDYVPQKYSVKQIMSSSWDKEIIPTRPDNAQYQIMRLMLLNAWKHVRILNLSDLRNGNSGDFSIEFKKAEKLDGSNPHSLTHKDRSEELKQYCSESNAVIVAWGSTEVLRESAKTFLKEIQNVRGLPLESPWFRYPSPYKKDQKLNWLESMNVELNT